MGRPLTDFMIMNLEHESEGTGIYSRELLQGKLNRALLTGGSQTFRFRRV